MKLNLSAVALSLLITQPAFAAAVAPGGEGGDPTQADVVLLIVYILMALIVSFLCSVAEAVLLSITPSYIASLRETHPKRAQLIAKLKQANVDQSLAAILTLNTIAHTVGAIGAGAKATIVFGSAWFGAFSAVMTLLILFLSEIVPKTLGAVYWRLLAGPTAQFVRALIIGLFPLIWISERLTRLIARGRNVHAFSREEFVALAGEVERKGHLDASESRIIRNLFHFKSLNAEDVMTPRTVIQAMPSDTPLDEAIERVRQMPFSRIPIYEENIDRVTGFVLRGDILLAASNDDKRGTLESIKRELLTTPKGISISVVLEKMLDERKHMTLVVGEYGETLGLATLEDIVETLLGTEIVDEIDRVEDMQAYARKRWENRARALGVEIESPTEAPSESG